MSENAKKEVPGYFCFGLPARGIMGGRSLVIVSLLLPLLWLSTSNAQYQDVEEAIRQVVVISSGSQTFLRRGTAFHVGGGIFYTNAHVVKSKVPEGFTDWYLASKTSTRSISTWLGPFTVVCVHPRWRDSGDPAKAHPYDVAQVKSAIPPDLPAFAFRDGPPKVGQRVTIKGFPIASWAWPPILYAAAGRISEVRRQDQTFRIEIESGFTLEGSSGSPVLAEDGRVVGIIYARVGAADRSASYVMSGVLSDAALEGCPH